jgi:hypothetical protein
LDDVLKKHSEKFKSKGLSVRAEWHPRSWYRGATFHLFFVSLESTPRLADFLANEFWPKLQKLETLDRAKRERNSAAERKAAARGKKMGVRGSGDGGGRGGEDVGGRWGTYGSGGGDGSVQLPSWE